MKHIFINNLFKQIIAFFEQTYYILNLSKFFFLEAFHEFHIINFIFQYSKLLRIIINGVLGFGSNGF